MKCILLLISVLTLFGCTQEKPISSFNPENWSKRAADIRSLDSLILGSTYLSVYSEIYEKNEHGTHTLAATISMRNISSDDTLFIRSASYYNTHGEMIRTYFEDPIYLLPLETVEIVIDKDDKTGGSGANFIFDWSSPNEKLEPYFEAVMISNSSQQGMSFTTRGIRRY